MRHRRVEPHASRGQPGGCAPAAVPALEDPDIIDARYGLEPVFEPGGGDGDADREQGNDDGASCFQVIHCPYCGEPFETLVDLSAGSADYIEDCQVCCRPIQFHLEVDHEGHLISLTAGRDG